MPFVLGASIAVCWAFDDQDHPTAELALERVRTDKARVPSFWWFEVRNTLIVSERRGPLTERELRRFCTGLRDCESRLIGGARANRLRRLVSLSQMPHEPDGCPC